MPEQQNIKSAKRAYVEDGVQEIDLLELMKEYIKFAWFIIGAALIGAMLAFLYTKLFIQPVYQSTTSVYVVNKQADASISYSDTTLSSQLTKDYEKLIKSRYVLEKVIEECQLNATYESLLANVSTENPSGTHIINIMVKDTSPVRAQRVANCIRNIAAEHIKSVIVTEVFTVLDEANLPKTPIAPSKKRNTAMGFLLGGFLSAAIVTVVFLLDDSIKNADDVEKYLGVSVLSSVPKFSKKSKKNNG